MESARRDTKVKFKIRDTIAIKQQGSKVVSRLQERERHSPAKVRRFPQPARQLHHRRAREEDQPQKKRDSRQRQKQSQAGDRRYRF